MILIILQIFRLQESDGEKMKENAGTQEEVLTKVKKYWFAFIYFVSFQNITQLTFKD